MPRLIDNSQQRRPTGGALLHGDLTDTHVTHIAKNLRRGNDLMAETTPYREPLALVILSTISIGLAAIAALWILIDIILRRGWRSMMLIM